MADVGRMAEVSAQTVSRFFNNGYVSEDARQRISEAVEELGYRQNKLPRSLRLSRTDSIGYLNVGPINHGSGSILTGLSRAARAAGQALLTTQLDLDPHAPDKAEDVRHALETFLSLRVDGIIVGTPYSGLNTVVETIGKAVPLVALSDQVASQLSSVQADSHAAACLAVEHLVALGHRRILHLAGPSITNEASERVRGFRDTMARHGLDAAEPIYCDAWTARAGYAAADALDPSEFTAVFAGNDLLALGLMSRLHSQGLLCPRDYSVIGIDDSPEDAFYTPALSSVWIDFEQMGEMACRLLLGHIAEPHPALRLHTTTQLRVRDSTAAPSRAMP
ncbi:hypothetical protein BW730_11070 [Tessaracoccus aquimaris]|uniref:HTH lacI-type domain-containing protein n=1 Tax=Tessaracoccus aquimaris TaxID=1332264 RepID=A0A1Q2CPI6_9ACTN|nr:LacI family DNA-binding transcriptional regulator [Tessaracoccus aquimaris]AQP47950.1 hypothetical protein BW730_11070 [Tessaracoccus aquimaris]